MTSFMALAWKELLILSRDRHGLAVLFAMPAVFILIMSLALRDAMNPGERLTLNYLWLDEDRGYFALSLGDALAGRQNLARTSSAGTLAELQERVRTGEVLFAVHVPAGLHQRIAAAATFASAGDYVPATPAAADPESAQKKTPLAVAYLSPSAPPQARLLFLAQLRAALTRVQTEYMLEDLLGVPREDSENLRAQGDPAQIPLETVYVGASGAAVAAPNAVQQSVPAWLVFAMFFVVLPISVSVLAEREQGNLQRLALLNISPARLLAAKFPAYYAVNLAQLLLMLAVGAYLVPLLGGDRLELSGNGFGLWLVASALSMAAISFALLVSVIAKTAVQATTLGGIANLIFGAVGGVMVPKLVMPPVMQSVSVVSPMSWALEACWDILLRGGGVMEILPECLALLGFGLACYAGAVFLYPRHDA